MRIEYLVAFAGPGIEIQPGEIREVNDAEAQRLIDRGYARPVLEGAPLRSAPPERAISTRATRRERAVRG